MKYKYPYIPNKRMFAAVMGACSYIRETGYFNKAVSYYAEKYGVDEKELAAHIRARQAAGQKGVNKGRKYRWFILAEVIDKCEGSISTISGFSIHRAFCYENANHHFFDEDLQATKASDTGSVYSPAYSHIVVGSRGGYATKQEASQQLEAIKKIAKDCEYDWYWFYDSCKGNLG